MAPPTAMPAWSIVKTCHTGLAPRPGSANALTLFSGTVFACTSPAALTTVPMRVTTPSDSSVVMAAAASGVAGMAPILHAQKADGVRRQGLQRDLAGLPDVQRSQHPAHAQPHGAGQCE